MRYLILLCALSLLAPSRGAAQSLDLGLSLGGGARVSTYSGAVDWSRSWSADWPSGIPAPTIECEADADSFDCTGATASVVGAPTYVTAAGYPERWAARLNGTTDYYTLGDIGDPWTDYSICIQFNTLAVAANRRIVTKGGAGGDALILRVENSGVLKFYAFSAVSNSSISSAALSVGVWNTACVSYDYVANGTSIMRMNLNGVESTPVTNAVGPAPDVAEPLKVGAAGGVIGEYFSGDVLSVRVWYNALSASEQALWVASQQARLAAKPVNALVTVSSGATTAIGTSGTMYSLPANSLACGAAGCEIWSAAAHSNLLTNSESGNAGATTVNYEAGPQGGSPTAERFTMNTNVETVWQSSVAAGTTLANKMFYLSVWLKAVSTPCSAYFGATDTNAWTAGQAVQQACSIGTTWGRCLIPVVYGSGALGSTAGVVGPSTKGRLGNPDLPACDLSAVNIKFELSPVAGPYVATAGTPVAGAADSSYTDDTTGKITDARGCVAAEFTVNAWTANARAVGFNGAAVPGLSINATNSFSLWDGTAPVVLNSVSCPGSVCRVLAWWSGSAMGLLDLNGGGSSSGAYDGTMFTGTPRLFQASQSGTANHLNGPFKRLVWGRTLSECRRMPQ